MQKYNWSVDTLITRAEDLEKLYKFEERKKDRDENLLKTIKYDYEVIANEVFEMMNNDGLEMPSLLESYEYLKSLYEKCEFLWSDISFFEELTKNKLISVPTLKKNSFSKEDLLTLTHDFYRDLGNSFYGNFMKCFYRRKDHTRFVRDGINNSCEGSTIHLLTFNEDFITIRRDNTIKDFTNLVHEYAHATLFQMNPEAHADTNNIFTELLPNLMEILALDYYYKVTKDNNAIIEKVNGYNSSLVRSDFANHLITLIEEERELGRDYESNKELKMVALNKCGLTCEELNNMLEHPIMTADIILENYLLGLELYYLKDNDKDKFLNTIKKIALLDLKSKEEYYSSIKKLGITQNLHTRDFRDDLKGQVLKLTR